MGTTAKKSTVKAVTAKTKAASKVKTTKPPTINLPITSLAEFKKAVPIVLSQDGARESKIASWTYPKVEGVDAFIAMPPRGTQRPTLTRIAPKLGGHVIYVNSRGAIAVQAPIKGKFLEPVSPMETFADVKQSAKYYILAGGITGIPVTGWQIWLASNQTDVIIMPEAGVPDGPLHQLVEKMGGGHVDPQVTPQGGGRKRAAVVVGIKQAP